MTEYNIDEIPANILWASSCTTEATELIEQGFRSKDNRYLEKALDELRIAAIALLREIAGV